MVRIRQEAQKKNPKALFQSESMLLFIYSLAYMTIAEATYNELPAIMKIFIKAKQYMRKEGNMTQWNGSYPSIELMQDEISQHHCFICREDDDTLVGVFCLIAGKDPTYTKIEGRWLNEKPYATIHRMASNGKHRGLAQECFDWCFNIYHNLRVDTHKDNATMNRAILKNGFEYCGIIYIADGTPRLAYQRTQ